jgi:DNA-directed RNA polymerase subunit RPC12/RpoP
MTTAAPPTLEREFPCKRCGGKLQFAPGTDRLVCPYCGAENVIAVSGTVVPLLDFEVYAKQTVQSGEVHDALVVHCTGCGAETKLAADVTSGRCAFCGSPVVAEGESKKLIKPAGLLPFAVNKAQANELFHKWIAGLWFAPDALGKRAEQAGIDGAYIPCWTYNADTTTNYTGERGEDYQTTETFTELVNGRPELRTRTVTHTRWTPASGVVRNRFADVLVLATQSLPPKQAAHLQPWDVEHIVPYADDYLSGMSCQSYQVDLVGGFEGAKQVMAPVIRQTICRNIGGDHQRVGSALTDYENVRFRHLLVPLWISAYQFGGRSFRFLVNARTGEVQGERPYSPYKIAGLVAACLAVLLAAVMMSQMHWN